MCFHMRCTLGPQLSLTQAYWKLRQLGDPAVCAFLQHGSWHQITFNDCIAAWHGVTGHRSGFEGHFYHVDVLARPEYYINLLFLQELLESNLGNCKANIKTTDEDLGLIKDNITTLEVWLCSPLLDRNTC